MMYPVIKVRDTQTGTEHIVGTNVHDRLYIDNGGLQYINIQCCEGTKGGSYEFVGIDYGECASWPMREDVEMVGFDELMDISRNDLDQKKEAAAALFRIACDEFHDWKTEKGIKF